MNQIINKTISPEFKAKEESFLIIIIIVIVILIIIILSILAFALLYFHRSVDLFNKYFTFF